MVTSNNYVSDLEFSELAESDSEWVDGLYSALGYHDYGYSLPRDTPEQIHGSVDRVIFSGNSPLTVDEKIRNRPCSDMLFELTSSSSNGPGWLKKILLQSCSVQLILSVGYPVGGSVVLLSTNDLRKKIGENGFALFKNWEEQAQAQRRGFKIIQAGSGARCIIVPLHELRRVFGAGSVASYTPDQWLIQRAKAASDLYASMRRAGLSHERAMQMVGDFRSHYPAKTPTQIAA